jgi:hypothetical protein
MFGRHPRLAIDAFLGLPTDGLSSSIHSEYVIKLNDRLRSAYAKARETAVKTSETNKAYYDQKARSSVLQPGDRVLVRNVSIRGKQKLADKWEHSPYIVVSQPLEDIPVYEVKKEGSRFKKTRTLHRNLLLPFMSISDVPVEDKQMELDIVDDSGDLQTDVDVTDAEHVSVENGMNLNNDCSFSHSDISISGEQDDDEIQPEQSSRPIRTRRQPNWMSTGD